MPLTSPDNVYFSDTTTPTDLPAITAAQATSVQNALVLRGRYSFTWANVAARNAQTGMVNGSTGWQTDTKTEYIYDNFAWRVKVPYVEFTTSGSIPAGALTYGGVPSMNLAATTDSTFCTPNGDSGVVFNQAGIYSLSVFTQMTTGTFTGLTYMQVSANYVTTDATAWLSRAPGQTGDNTITASVPLFRVASAGTPLWFSILQVSGATRTMNSLIKIARIG